MNIIGSLIVTGIVIFLVYLSVYFDKDEREEREKEKLKNMTDKEKNIYFMEKNRKKQKAENRRKKREKLYQEIAEYNYERKQSKTITKAMIIGQDSRKSTGSALARSIVGESLLGPTGAIVGSVTAKNKNSTTFLVEYADGHRETKTVENNSFEYNEIIKHLEM